MATRKRAKSNPVPATRDWRPLAALAGLFTVAFLLADAAPLEDAFISFRVLENFLHGHGLVFNPGERVEAYSNFLWVMFLVPFRLVFTNIVVASKLAGWLVGLGVLWVSDQLLREELPDPWQRFTALVALALCPHFLIFCIYGLEQPLVYLLCLAAVLLLVKERPAWASLCCGLLAMTRPEGFFYYGVISLAYLWLLRGRIPWRRWLVPFVICFGGLTIFRLAYYGYPFPNTVYGKAFSSTALGSLLPGEGPELPRKISHGAIQIGNFIARGFYWPILLLAAWGALRRRKPASRSTALLLIAVIVATAVFILGTGGNFFGRYRFWSVAVPPLLLLGAMGAGRFTHPAWRWSALALLVLIPLASPEHEPRPPVDVHEPPFWVVKTQQLPSEGNFFENAGALFARFSRQPDTLNRRLGDWLGDLYPSGTLIGTGQIGQIGYYSELPILDVVGLADTTIARGGASLDYFLRRDPECFLVLGDRFWDKYEAHRPISPHIGIYLTDEFRKHYRWRAILTGPPPHESFYWYEKRPKPLASAPELEHPPVYELPLNQPIPLDLSDILPAE